MTENERRHEIVDRRFKVHTRLGPDCSNPYLERYFRYTQTQSPF